MTALVVKMTAQKTGHGGGVIARRQLRESEQYAVDKLTSSGYAR